MTFASQNSLYPKTDGGSRKFASPVIGRSVFSFFYVFKFATCVATLIVKRVAFAITQFGVLNAWTNSISVAFVRCTGSRKV